MLMSNQTHFTRVFLASLLAGFPAYANDRLCLEQTLAVGSASIALAGHGNVLLLELADNNQLQVMEILAPNTVQARGVISIQGGSLETGFDLNSSHAFVAIGDVLIYDLTDLENPQWVTTIPFFSGATNVTVTDSLAFVTTAIGSMEIFDISSLPTATYLTTVWLAGGTGINHIVVNDNLLCNVAVDTFGEVTLLDITNPRAPRLLSRINNLAPYSADFLGNRLVVGGVSELFVIDIQDPNIPVIQGTHALDARATGIALRGDNAFVATRDWVGRFDLSDPNGPSLYDQTFADAGQGLYLRDTRLHASDTQEGLRVYVLESCAGVGLAGDCDGSGSVDWPDYLILDGCLDGPGVEGSSECRCFDLDADGGQTVRDAALFQKSFGFSMASSAGGD